MKAIGQVVGPCLICLASFALAIAGKQGHQGVSTEPGAQRMPGDGSISGEWAGLSLSPDWEERRVSRPELGDEWPFTVDEGMLRCEGGAVTFTSGRTTYAINRAALIRMKVEATSREAREVGARDLSPIVSLGLALCS